MAFIILAFVAGSQLLAKSRKRDNRRSRMNLPSRRDSRHIRHYQCMSLCAMPYRLSIRSALCTPLPIQLRRAAKLIDTNFRLKPFSSFRPYPNRYGYEPVLTDSASLKRISKELPSPAQPVHPGTRLATDLIPEKLLFRIAICENNKQMQNRSTHSSVCTVE